MDREDDHDDCALCGGPCQLEDGEATVTREDLERLEEQGLLKQCSSAEAEAWELRQREALRLKYGTDDPIKQMEDICRELSALAGIGAGKES